MTKLIRGISSIHGAGGSGGGGDGGGSDQGGGSDGSGPSGAVVERGGGAGGIRTGRGNMGVGGGGECDEAPRDLTSMLVYVYSVYVAGGARPRSRACANVRLHSSTRRQCQLDQLGLRPQ